MVTHRAPPAPKIHRAPPAPTDRRIETVPNDMLNWAVKNLKHNSALYLRGNYIIEEPLQCTNKIGVSIFGNHSKIIADPTFPSNKPMLDCCGTFRSTFYDLWLETDPKSQPAAGLLIGRNATLNGKPMNGSKCPPLNQWNNGECPNGPLDVSKKPPSQSYKCFAAPWSGGKCLFSNIDIKGTYGVSPYYNCMGENHTFINSHFRSTNEKPAYVDTCYDFAQLTGLQCINYSNVDKYFYACVFSNNDPNENPIQLINLYRSQQNISFRDCYFATGPHPGSTVIDLTQGGDNGQTFNLLIDGGRVEIGGPKELSDPSDIRLLRISRKCEDARIVGLRYCIKSDYLIHLKGNGQLINPTLSISKSANTQMTETGP